MSNTLRHAVVQHALDVSQLYKDNCALTRGLPQATPRLRIADESDEQPPPVAPQPQQPQPVAPQPVQPQPTPTKPTSWLLPIAATTAALLGGAGIGAGANWYLNRPTTTTIIEQPGDESLLQYLEDKGMHLPPSKRGVP